MGVSRFKSQVVASAADIEKLAESFEKLSRSVDNSGKSARAEVAAEHPGFEAFAEKVKAGIEDPLNKRRR